MYKKVIVPICGKDRSDRSMKALLTAIKLCNGEIVIMHVTEPISQVVGGEQREKLEKENYAKGMEILFPAAEKLKMSAMPFHTRVAAGTPAETIVTVADEEQADLIVMYTDGRDGLKDLFLGSITERVLRNTSVNLLAVRG